MTALGCSGCDEFDTCGVQGDTQACLCSDGRPGAQRCLPEGVWDECVCSGEILLPDGAVPGAPANPMGGGAGTAAPGDGMMTPDNPMMPTPGDDGGTPGLPPVDAGAPSTPAPIDAGAMPEPDAGDAGGDMTPVDAYVTCTAATVATDCPVASSACRQNTDPFNPGNVCAPPCTTAADCPQPEGTYDATLACDTMGRCRLDCAGVPTLSCPAGMVCLTSLAGFGGSSCYPQ
ncbi:MAG: hypothetical protein PVI30_13215 [Myxococcales bacterium]